VPQIGTHGKEAISDDFLGIDWETKKQKRERVVQTILLELQIRITEVDVRVVCPHRPLKSSASPVRDTFPGVTPGLRPQAKPHGPPIVDRNVPLNFNLIPPSTSRKRWILV